jgi:hypothetical protein
VNTTPTLQDTRATNIRQAQCWFLVNVGLVYFWHFILDYVIQGSYFSQQTQLSVSIFAVLTVSIMNFYLALKTRGAWRLAYLITGILTIAVSIVVGVIGVVPVIPHLPSLVRAVFQI